MLAVLLLALCGLLPAEPLLLRYEPPPYSRDVIVEGVAWAGGICRYDVYYRDVFGDTKSFSCEQKPTQRETIDGLWIIEGVPAYDTEPFYFYTRHAIETELLTR